MSEAGDSEHQSKDMMNMFASVWVKIEVNDEDNSISYENPQDDHDYQQKKKRERRSKTLKCNMCDYTTVYKNCLELHILGHTNTKPYSCDTCDYTTKYPTSLHRHVLIQHEFKKKEQDENAPQFKCDDCDYTSHFKWNLNAHKRKHKLEKKYKCELCSYETAYRHNYLKHSKIHNKQEVIYKCDKCAFVTKFEGHISRHLAKIHNEVSDKANKCDLCDFTTKIKWRLNIHKQRSKQKDVIKCSYCEFETYYMCESKKHKISHYNEIYRLKLNDNNEENLGVSSIEPEPSPSIDFANQSTHEKNNHYKLDTNGEVIEWNNIQVKETSNRERPFQCIMCKYTSRFKASVQRHFQRHHTGSQNRPYKCCNCDFSTKTKDQIALHNKRSKSEVPLFCTECDFSTLFKCQFVMHQKCHYAHKCTICNYSCKTKYDIQKHLSTIHMGNGLKCRFCDYKASRKESLLCHETIHTGNKPFNCSYCDYKSVRKSLLVIHLKRYHSDIKKDTVVVSDSKIQSLKVPVGDFMQEINQEKVQNICMEDIMKSQDVIEAIIKSTQHSGL